MRVTWRRILPLGAGLIALVGLLAIRLMWPDPFVRAQLFGADVLQRIEPWSNPAPRVRIVDIDDASLGRLGQWPWSRSTLADLVAALRRMGAKAIVFDVVFAEFDRSSPALLAAKWARAYGWKRADGGAAALPDYDATFAAAIQRGRVVTGFGLLSGRNGASPRISAGIATIGGDPTETMRNFRGAVPNLAPIEGAAAGNGSFSIDAGQDQVVRQVPLILAFAGKVVPSLALEAVRVAQDERTIKIKSEGDDAAETGYTIRVGDYDIPARPDGSLLLHYGRDRVPSIPAWSVLAGTSDAELHAAIDGRIVLIGTSAVGLVDLRATPIAPAFPGVAIHAQALEQILAHHFLRREVWMPRAEMAAAAAIGLAMILLATWADLSAALAISAGCVTLAAIAYVAAFAIFGEVIDISLVFLVSLPAMIVATFARYLGAERDAAKLRSAFAQYLAPPLVAALARHPERLKLGGELREMTFVFTDLEGFTALTEASRPSEVVAWLNEYLDGICAIAMDHGGTIDKIVGDAVHIMFNAPLDQADHPARAVRCALAIDAFARRLQAAKRAEGLRFGSTRIGVNTGSAVVGNFGGSRRFDYTAHGDAINTAARLETANKRLGTSICVSRSTADKVGDVTFLPVATLLLKGKAEAVEALMPTRDDQSWLAAHRDAYAQMDRGDLGGARRILDLASTYPDHCVLALQAATIRSGAATMRLSA